MSLPRNNITRSVAPKSLFESAKSVLSTDVSYNQGDLIALDTGDNVLKPATASGDIDNLLGVARQTIIDGVTKSPYLGTAVDASQAIEDVAGPVYGVVASLYLAEGEEFNPGDKVYLTSDAQTVTSTDPGSGKHVGLYQGASIDSAAAGELGDVLVGARYSLNDSIQF